MSRNNYKHLRVGDFVRCNFPHMRLDPREPSEHEHVALIVGKQYDRELGVPVFTMVHSSKEIERLVKTGGKIRAGSFKLLVYSITGRVPVSDISDRIVNYDQVMLLPVVKEFFHDLEHGPIAVIDSISRRAVEKIKLRMKKPPNAAALATYRMEHQHQAVTPDFLVKRRLSNENDPS